VPLWSLPGGVIPIRRVCAYDRRKVFCVRRTDVTLEVDGSFYFNQDALAVRATIRVGFGFRMPLGGRCRCRRFVTACGATGLLSRWKAGLGDGPAPAPQRPGGPGHIHYRPSAHLRGPSPGEVAPRWLVRFPTDAAARDEHTHSSTEALNRSSS